MPYCTSTAKEHATYQRTANPERVQHCVETLCLQGCKAVRQHIAALEAGRTDADTRNLSPDEREGVLKELKSIMAVYSNP